MWTANLVIKPAVEIDFKRFHWSKCFVCASKATNSSISADLAASSKVSISIAPFQIVPFEIHQRALYLRFTSWLSSCIKRIAIFTHNWMDYECSILKQWKKQIEQHQSTLIIMSIFFWSVSDVHRRLNELIVASANASRYAPFGCWTKAWCLKIGNETWIPSDRTTKIEWCSGQYVIQFYV